MTIGELIKTLEGFHREHEVLYGFGAADSWRGSYEQCAFKPVKNTTVGEMLKHAKAAIGPEFYGYKGGTYTFGEHTMCHVAKHGDYREDSEMSPALLGWMLGHPIVPALWDDAEESR